MRKANQTSFKKGHIQSEESRKKMSIAKIGFIPWNKGTKGLQVAWNKGMTSLSTKENEKKRRNWAYKMWRIACLERDNFTCQISGQKGGKLEVHHINNFTEFPELRYDITNGITITRKLHIEFHQKYGKRNNTRSQLEEFLSAIVQA